MVELIVAIVSFAAGAFAVWLVMHARAEARHHAARAELGPERAALMERLKGAEERLSELGAALRDKGSALEARQAEIGVLKSAQAELSERLQHERKAAEDKLALLDEAQQRDAFKALSAEALRSNNQVFLDLARPIQAIDYRTYSPFTCRTRCGLPRRQVVASLKWRQRARHPSHTDHAERVRQAVAYGWRQEALARNAQQISDRGKQLYERIATLAGHWSDVGNRLDKAVDAYNRSVATLESRVLVSARRFRDLSAALEGVELASLEPVDHAPRQLQAPDLSPPEKSDV